MKKLATFNSTNDPAILLIKSIDSCCLYIYSINNENRDFNLNIIYATIGQKTSLFRFICCNKEPSKERI